MALDLGGTKLAGALVESDGTLCGHREVPLAGRKGEEAGALLQAEVRRLAGLAAEAGSTPDGLGVSIPGIYYPEEGRVWAPNIPGWNRYPLREELRAMPEASAISCLRIEDDRACGIRGEAWLGAAQGCRSALFLTVGTGIGAGILLDGKTLRGAGGAAGAVGWMALRRPYRREYAEAGCFEYYASGTGISRQVRLALSREGDRNFGGHPLPAGPVPFQQVFDAYLQEDPTAVRILDQAIDCWGMAVANLVSLFNPEIVLFGGGLFGPAVRFLERIAAEARLWAQPESMRAVRLAASRLDRLSALYGAAWLALHPGD